MATKPVQCDRQLRFDKHPINNLTLPTYDVTHQAWRLCPFQWLPFFVPLYFLLRIAGRCILCKMRVKWSPLVSGMGEEEGNFKPELIRQELFSTEFNAIRIIDFDLVYTLLSRESIGTQENTVLQESSTILFRSSRITSVFYPHKLCCSGMLLVHTMFRVIGFQQHSEVSKDSMRPLLQANKHTHMQQIWRTQFTFPEVLIL